ncbi:MAG TPA: hypothetical protein VJR89_01350, partial [Polyangiales bacterium]|nr:hypothetical protein [Polyangiales bacterium]
PAALGSAPGPRSASGIALGSALVSQFGQRVGAQGGLYAWPAEDAPPPGQGKLGIAPVPRLFGPQLETSSGALLAHALLVLEVGPDGVRVVL